MVGVSSADTAVLGAQIEVTPPDPSFISQLRVVLAYRDASDNIVTVGSPGAINPTTMIAYFSTSVFPLAVNENYFVLVWHDANGDNVYTPGEAQRNTYQIWSAKLVNDQAYADSLSNLNIIKSGWDALGWDDAVRFMDAFINNAYIAGATPAMTSVTNNTPRLSHNTGAMWNTSGVASIRLNVFPATSPLSDLVRASKEFKDMVTKTLTDGKPTVQGYVWQPGETEHVFTFRVPIGTGISFTDSKNLNFSIGKAELRDVVLKAKVRKSDLELVQLDITGRVNDLYDFDNEATLAWFGARVQAGFQAAIPGKFHGHIYESDVFVDKINYPFQFNFR